MNDRGQIDAHYGTYTAIATNGLYSCALTAEGVADCWGHIYSGLEEVPKADLVSIAAGASFFCAIQRGGAVACWGDNSSGQIDAPDGVYTAVAAGGSHSCAIAPDDTVNCWDWTTNLPEGIKWAN